jgi:hypothetical protein
MTLLKTASLALSLAGFTLTGGVAFADIPSITITVTPTLAPNAYGSPSWAAWEANSITALENGLSSYGDPTLPTYYQAQSMVNATQTVVTDFPSWMGQAISDPNSPFANEYGNRMTFGLTILGNGQTFSISQLGFNAVSNDAGNALGFGYAPGPVTGYDYTPNYVGVIYGIDGAAATNEYTYVTCSTAYDVTCAYSDSQLVNALYSRGSGNSFAALCNGPCTAADGQDQINATAEYMNDTNLTQFTGTYYLMDGQDTIASGSGTFNIATPEPSTWLLMLGAIPVIVGGARRRRTPRANA